MPQLQSCYFCGEIGDALTTVDVVPADLADESTQRTVVVCSTCHRKLDAVLTPLRDLAAAGGASEADAGDSTTAEHGAPTAEDAAGTAAGDGPDDIGGTTDAESPLAPTDRVDEQTADAGPSDITFPDAARTSDDATDEQGDGIEFSGSADERDSAETDDDTLLGGADGDPDSAPGGENEAAADETEAASGDPSGDSETASGDPSGDSETASEEASADDTAADTPSDDPPTGYRKVVRLLQNREFPVERESFVDLASNAYELEESAVSASLDRLVERGALVESGGKLQKP